MDKSDLDLLIDSEDTDLIYKHILKAICSSPYRIQNGFNRYTIDQVIIHSLTTCIIYRSKQDVNIKRVGKYVMEL